MSKNKENQQREDIGKITFHRDPPEKTMIRPPTMFGVSPGLRFTQVLAFVPTRFRCLTLALLLLTVLSLSTHGQKPTPKGGDLASPAPTVSPSPTPKTAMRDWNDREDKGSAIVDVLRYIMSPPAPLTYEQVARRCIKQDNYARLLFEEVGKVRVPDHARVVFLETSQHDLKERGSLVIEIPPSTLQITADPAHLANYVHRGLSSSSGGSQRRNWNNPQEKRDAVTDVLRYLLTQPVEVRERCLKDDTETMALFTESRIGNINVPVDAKTILVPSGEQEKEVRGSLVIAVPPVTMATAPREQLLLYAQCCYRQW